MWQDRVSQTAQFLRELQILSSLRHFHLSTPLKDKKRLAMAAVGVLLVGAVLLASCAKDEPKSGDQLSRAPVPVNVAEVRQGEISASVSFPGEAQAIDRVELSPSAGGRVVNVMVEEGQQVTAGDPLAQLESETLEAQVKQAQATLANAHAQLTRVLEGARPEEVAASRAALESLRQRVAGMIVGGRPEQVAAAEANLQSARARLAEVVSGVPFLRAASLASMEAARSVLTSTERSLEKLRNPTTSDIQAAQASVDAARATLNGALARQKDLLAKPKPIDLVTAQAALDAAEASLRKAEATLSDLKQTLNTQLLKDLIEVYTAVTLARDKLTYDRARGASDAVIADDEKALLIAYRNQQQRETDAGLTRPGISAEQLIAAQTAADAARSARDSARQGYDDVVAGPKESERESAQASVDSATSQWELAKIALRQLQNPTEATIAAAEATVENARASYSAAQAKWEQIKDNPMDSSLTAAQAAVAAAEQTLVLTKAPFTNQEIASQQALIDQADQQLSLVANKYTRADIASATAAVALAEASLTTANVHLKNATITAPFDGVVARKYVSKGALVSAQSPVFSLVSREVQVVFNVEEASIGRLQVGQNVSLITSALGEQAFQGKVLTIAPVADPASRTFRVTAIPIIAGSPLKGGMFTNVSVATETRARALIVPRSAIIQQGADSFVYIVENKRASLRKVAVGLTNEGFVEITSGLDAGQQVVIQGNRSLRQDDEVQVLSGS